MTFLALLLAGGAALAVQPADTTDVDAFCQLTAEHYVYFEPRRSYWDEACDAARADIESTSGNKLAVYEGLVDALYDPHVNLGVNNGASPRLVPSGLDIRLVLTADGTVRIAGIRPGTSAAKAGLRLGDEVVAIYGQPPLEAARGRITAGPEDLPGRLDWALNAAMAGYRDAARSVTVRRDGEDIRIALEAPEPAAPSQPVTSRWAADGVGYIRLENSLGQDDTVPAFRQALGAFHDAKGLVLDLRNTPSGGNTGVAEPILGAFLEEKAAYQLTVPPGQEPEPRFAGPADGEAFAAPVIVLVGHWTGSMGEGLAIGFDATGAGTVMGTRMARLAGGTEGFSLPQSGIRFWLPTYDLTHVDGTPRHQWAPSPELPADFGDGEDLLLEEAVRLLME